MSVQDALCMHAAHRVSTCTHHHVGVRPGRGAHSATGDAARAAAPPPGGRARCIQRRRLYCRQAPCIVVKCYALRAAQCACGLQRCHTVCIAEARRAHFRLCPLSQQRRCQIIMMINHRYMSYRQPTASASTPRAALGVHHYPAGCQRRPAIRM